MSEIEQEARKIVLEDIAEVTQGRWTDADIVTFGSYAAKLSIFMSDIDCAIVSRQLEDYCAGRSRLGDGLDDDEDDDNDGELEDPAWKRQRLEATPVEAGSSTHKASTSLTRPPQDIDIETIVIDLTNSATSSRAASSSVIVDLVNDDTSDQNDESKDEKVLEATNSAVESDKNAEDDDEMLLGMTWSIDRSGGHNNDKPVDVGNDNNSQVHQAEVLDEVNGKEGAQSLPDDGEEMSVFGKKRRIDEISGSYQKKESASLLQIDEDDNNSDSDSSNHSLDDEEDISEEDSDEEYVENEDSEGISDDSDVYGLGPVKRRLLQKESASLQRKKIIFERDTAETSASVSTKPASRSSSSTDLPLDLDLTVAHSLPMSRSSSTGQLLSHQSQSPTSQEVIVTLDQNTLDFANYVAYPTAYTYNNNANPAGTSSPHQQQLTAAQEAKQRTKRIKVLRTLTQQLRQHDSILSLELRHRAKVPIIALTHRSAVDCDLSLGLNESETLHLTQAMVNTCGAALYHLSAFLKVFLQQLHLDKPFTGGLGSFKLYVLITQHCLRSPQLIEDKDDPNLGLLLLTFLQYYGQKKHLHSETTIHLSLPQPAKIKNDDHDSSAEQETDVSDEMVSMTVAFSMNNLIAYVQKAFAKAYSALKDACRERINQRRDVSATAPKKRSKGGADEDEDEEDEDSSDEDDSSNGDSSDDGGDSDDLIPRSKAFTGHREKLQQHSLSHSLLARLLVSCHALQQQRAQHLQQCSQYLTQRGSQEDRVQRATHLLEVLQRRTGCMKVHLSLDQADRLLRVRLLSFVDVERALRGDVNNHRNYSNNSNNSSGGNVFNQPSSAGNVFNSFNTAYNNRMYNNGNGNNGQGYAFHDARYHHPPPPSATGGNSNNGSSQDRGSDEKQQLKKRKDSFDYRQRRELFTNNSNNNNTNNSHNQHSGTKKPQKTGYNNNHNGSSHTHGTSSVAEFSRLDVSQLHAQGGVVGGPGSSAEALRALSENLDDSIARLRARRQDQRQQRRQQQQQQQSRSHNLQQQQQQQQRPNSAQKKSLAAFSATTTPAKLTPTSTQRSYTGSAGKRSYQQQKQLQVASSNSTNTPSSNGQSRSTGKKRRRTSSTP